MRGGLPHSEIPGSPIARISPGLFAACHVLHRLSVPRHPPDALTLRLSATPDGKNRRTPPRTGHTAATRSRDQPPCGKPASHEDTSPEHQRRRPQLAARATAHAPSVSASVTSRTLSSPFNQPARRPASQSRRRCRLASRASRRQRQRLMPESRRAALPDGGGERDRTDDLLLAKQALSQLSYTPFQEIRDQEHRDQNGAF